MTYEELLNSVSSHYGSSPELLENSMDRIAYHESKGKNVYQEGGGPGAGLFQYERTFKDDDGVYGQAGGMTARNRLAGFFGDNVPDWLNQEGMNNPEIGFDASRLTPEQQKMLFLADKRMTPGVEMTPEHLSDLPKFWATSHWKGPESQYEDRTASFDRDMQDYDRFKQPVDDVYAGNDKLNRAFPTK